MVHTHIKTIETLWSCNNHTRKYNNIIDPIYSRIVIQPHHKNFPEDNKNENFLTWPGLNNQHLLKHLPPGITTALGHMYQERENLQSTKQVKSEWEIEEDSGFTWKNIQWRHMSFTQQ